MIQPTISDRVAQLGPIFEQAIFSSFSTQGILGYLFRLNHDLDFKLTTRKFAELIDVAPGSLTYWKQKNRITEEGVSKLVTVFSINEEAKKRLVLIGKLGNETCSKKRKTIKEALLAQSYLRNKQVFEGPRLQNIKSIRAIIVKELVAIKKRTNAEEIGKLLLMKHGGIQDLLKELVQKHILQIHEDGTFSCLEQTVEFNGIDAISDMVRKYFRDYQRSSYGYLMDYLDKYPVDTNKQRALVTHTMNVNPDRIPELREDIFQFIDKMAVKYDALDKPGVVYSLFLAGLPMTKDLREEQKNS